jgi:predicted deacylase
VGSKTVVKWPVEDVHHEVSSFIPVGILEGDRPGPTLAVIGGVHASEFAAHDGVARFWESLDPREISGKVYVVLVADVTAALGGRPTKQLMGIDTKANPLGTNPVDQKNLNRIWPGKKEGTLTEVIAHTLMQEVVLRSDAVIDCHGGEYNEQMIYYTITCQGGDAALDKRTLDLAMALGIPFVEVTDANGPWLGTGTSAGETVRSGRPGMIIEVGDRGIRDPQSISAVFNALENALRHLKMKKGTPVPWAGTPVKLQRGHIVKSKAAGLFTAKVTVGDWIETGQLFAEIRDFDDTLLEELRAPEAGVVLTVIFSRAIKADGFAGKIGVL